MSRCFPFPPPGYEKKARLDEDDSLNKDKQREKKPKKEKKEKEKREDKERKEKDRSDGKHRDKKDKKEKDKEKKKEKEKERERDKDKDRKTPSEDKRLAVQSDGNSREKVNQKQNERDRDKDKDKNSISDEKKQVLQFQGNNGDKPIRNSLFAEGTGDFKFVQELCRRIRDEEGGAGSQLVDRLPFTSDGREFVVKDAKNLAGGKEKNNEKGVDNRSIAGVDARCSGSAVVQNLVGLVQNRVEGLPRLLEKQIERRVEEKEKSKEREGGDKRGDKRKDKDKEKKSHGKDKESEKEKKKEEKVREKTEHKTKDGAKLQDSKKNEQLGALNVRNPHGTKDGDRNSATEGILKKRKDLEANGFLHATDARPNKMPRPSPHHSTENGRKLEPCHTAIQFTSEGTDVRPIKLPRPSPHPSVENGRKLEPCQTPILLTTGRQGPLSNLKLNNKELKVNGVIEPQPLPISSKKSPSPSTKAEKIAEASTKPPHPDSKYLSRVLSVPKMEEWSDFDDQEWLCSSKDCSAEKKPKVGSAESPMVWADALQIESADICALPYVIPY